MAGVMKAIAPHLRADAIVTDVGSTKVSVIAAARAELALTSCASCRASDRGAGAPRGRVVGAAPVRGQALYRDSVAETDGAATERVEGLWQRIGARVERMDAQEHDASSLRSATCRTCLRSRSSRRSRARTMRNASLPRPARDFATSPASRHRVRACGATSASRIARRWPLNCGVTGAVDELQAALDAGDGEAIEAVFRTAASAGARMRRGSTPSNARLLGGCPVHPTPVGLEQPIQSRDTGVRTARRVRCRRAIGSRCVMNGVRARMRPVGS